MNEQPTTHHGSQHDPVQASPNAPVTMADIAKATGFSTMTVSNALRGKPNVSEKNRERIRQIAQAMGYQANAAAMMLRNRRSGIIQVVVDDFEVPFHARIAKYLTQEATDLGYQTLVRQSSSSRAEEIRAIRPDPGLVYDGIILDAPNVTEDQVIGHVQGKPVLVIGDCASFERIDSMDTACTEGLEEAVEHLWRQGCRTFFVFGGSQRSDRMLHNDNGKGFAFRRMAAIETALSRHGITLPDIQRIGCTWDLQGGHEAAHTLASQSSFLGMQEHGNVGVVCMSDSIALGALGAFASLGVRVPDDVKITGLDGIPMGEYATPSLTTVEMDVPAMAHAVMTRMVAMIEARNRAETALPVTHGTIPFRLVRRASTAAL